MSGITKHKFSDSEGQLLVQFSRNALETYTRENQRMDVGSVEKVLNKRGGVLIQLENSEGRKQLRGTSAIFDGRRLADAIIDATIYAASNRSLGAEVHKSELNNIRIRAALIEEVIVTDEPEIKLNNNTYCPIIPQDINGWIHPIKSQLHDWSPKEYLMRTYKKANLNPFDWKDDSVVIVQTALFKEADPITQSVVRDKP